MGNLVLSRKVGQKLRIGDDILITVVRFKDDQVQLAVELPANIPIDREEIRLAKIANPRGPRTAFLGMLSVLIAASAAFGENNDRIWNAISHVESNHKSNAIGDGGCAVGVVQLHKVMVDECNRLAGRKCWTYQDRFSLVKSRQMFNIFMDKRCKGFSDERKARLWNSAKNTDRYWSKVRKELLRK